ncbi:enoyl-CoA hydratase-related protein [Nakamurella sp.]|uniref:enoyl-CoA hydratase-related protein n=1 Tax=Nakamurella sp. TaxID=1869182 RepID=UPI003784BFEB
MTDAPLVRFDRADGVGTITLDSPANRNALSARLRGELLTQLDAAIAEPAVRVIVLTHTGPVFCSGMDLKESAGASAGDQGVNELPRILETLWCSPTPVVARLAGPARAGGIGMVAACDIAVAVDTATFAFSEVRIGVIPAVISTVVLPRLQPRAAHELFLTGETFDAARAVQAGLLNRCVPADTLDAEVGRFVGLLRQGAPGALDGTKRLLRRPRGDLRGDLAALTTISAGFFAGSEAQEGMAAFREKRLPAWVTPPPPA